MTEAELNGIDAVLERAVADELDGLDLGQLVSAATRAAVKKQVEAIAKETVDAALTPERLGDLRERTVAAAEQSLVDDGTADTEDEEPAPELVFGSTEQWVTEWLVPSYRRYLSPNGAQTTWCAHWWKHPEAVMRLEALWRAWEHLRLDGQTGMSVWWKDHADYHLAVLLSEGGPFRGCNIVDGHKALLAPFPLADAPEGFFPDERPSHDDNATNDTDGQVR
ncbi:DUF4913 domain-containing protein [Plantibacter sp. Mn2098]|uniref:DUF4913 domain-containing protein n=1 Tax=Plantibacter sp. Mn2098 TaxID=3395266 RepID=UPI003BCF1A67